MSQSEEPAARTLVRLKRAAQITLPVEVRKQFHLEEGDYLEVQAVPDGILLKPVAVVERQQARAALRDLLTRVHTQQPPNDTTPAEQEQAITQMIKELRRDDATPRRA